MLMRILKYRDFEKMKFRLKDSTTMTEYEYVPGVVGTFKFEANYLDYKVWLNCFYSHTEGNLKFVIVSSNCDELDVAERMKEEMTNFCRSKFGKFMNDVNRIINERRKYERTKNR